MSPQTMWITPHATTLGHLRSVIDRLEALEAEDRASIGIVVVHEGEPVELARAALVERGGQIVSWPAGTVVTAADLPDQGILLAWA